MRVLLILLCLLIRVPDAGARGAAPPIYVFQNGLRIGSVDEGVRLLKRLGYQGVGSVYPKDLAMFKTACDREGLKLFSIYAGGMVNVDGFSYAPEVCTAISMLKGSGALVELNLQRGKGPTDEQAIALVREIAGKAKESGLKVVLYPHAGFHVERLDQALRIARASGCDNVGVTFNLCHFLKVQPKDDLATELEAAKPLLWSMSLCGADADGTDWSTLIRPLDEGTFDQAGLQRNLRRLGFEGPVGLQCYNNKTEPAENLSRSIESWKRITGPVWGPEPSMSERSGAPTDGKR